MCLHSEDKGSKVLPGTFGTLRMGCSIFANSITQQLSAACQALQLRIRDLQMVADSAQRASEFGIMQASKVRPDLLPSSIAVGPGIKCYSLHNSSDKRIMNCH